MRFTFRDAQGTTETVDAAGPREAWNSLAQRFGVNVNDLRGKVKIGVENGYTTSEKMVMKADARCPKCGDSGRLFVSEKTGLCDSCMQEAYDKGNAAENAAGKFSVGQAVQRLYVGGAPIPGAFGKVVAAGVGPDKNEYDVEGKGWKFRLSEDQLVTADWTNAMDAGEMREHIALTYYKELADGRPSSACTAEIERLARVLGRPTQEVYQQARSDARMVHSAGGPNAEGVMGNAAHMGCNGCDDSRSPLNKDGYCATCCKQQGQAFVADTAGETPMQNSTVVTPDDRQAAGAARYGSLANAAEEPVTVVAGEKGRDLGGRDIDGNPRTAGPGEKTYKIPPKPAENADEKCKGCGATGVEIQHGYCEKCSTITLTAEKKLKGFENGLFVTPSSKEALGSSRYGSKK